MKLPCLIFAGISFILLWSGSLVHAQQMTTNVRGQLLWTGWNQFGAPQSYAAPGVQVTLFSQAVGRSWPAVTGNDGMYYFYNIPLGDYYLEVWTSNPPKAQLFRIGGFPYHDLPRITIN
jgi:hypothetical protein